jgi:hypothetical protein
MQIEKKFTAYDMSIMKFVNNGMNRNSEETNTDRYCTWILY